MDHHADSHPGSDSRYHSNHTKTPQTGKCLTCNQAVLPYGTYQIGINSKYPTSELALGAPWWENIICSAGDAGACTKCLFCDRRRNLVEAGKKAWVEGRGKSPPPWWWGSVKCAYKCGNGEGCKWCLEKRMVLEACRKAWLEVEGKAPPQGVWKPRW
jgi:hypothetical protein